MLATHDIHIVLAGGVHDSLYNFSNTIRCLHACSKCSALVRQKVSDHGYIASGRDAHGCEESAPKLQITQRVVTTQ